MEIDKALVENLVHRLVEKVQAYYIYPEVAIEVSTRLQQHLAEGVYDDISEGEFLAYALTSHLQEVTQDQHLWVRWHAVVLPEHEGSLLNNPQKVAQMREKARLENYGIYKLERLPGNIGYIDLRYFFRTSWGSGDAVVAGMGFLANMNAVVIDLRQCSGGNPASVAFVCSYFFGEEPVHLNDLYWREGDVTEQYWTLPYVPGKRITQQPLFILTSGDTFSAGEEFAYNLQALKRATIVGERTGGGAHPGSPYRLQPHFEVFIPNGRAVNPVTGQDWEGKGVQVDVSVPAEQALEAAHELALLSVIKEIQGQDSEPYQKLKEEAEAALQVLQDR